MAVTLTQANYYDNNKMAKGVVETLIKESPILARLPFESLVGNALAIAREDSDNAPTVEWRAVNGTWTESTGDVTQHTFALKILGGDADVDNFLQKTRTEVASLMATQVKMKAKQMAHEFEDCFIYGSSSGTNQFDGLHTLITALSGQQINAGSGSTEAVLTTVLLDQLVDTIKGGKPDFILMNRNIRRRLSVYLRAVGSYNTERDDYGNFWVMWNEIPILVSDFLTQTETISGGDYSAKTGGSSSSVFAVRLGSGDGLCGIQNGGITTETWDKLETKDASRTRIKWYVGTALYSGLSVARIDGVKDDAMSA
jgi:hypothetical protein